MIYVESNNTVREYHTSPKIEKAVETLLKDTDTWSAETNEGYTVAIVDKDCETIAEYIDKHVKDIPYKGVEPWEGR